MGKDKKDKKRTGLAGEAARFAEAAEQLKDEMKRRAEENEGEKVAEQPPAAKSSAILPHNVLPKDIQGIKAFIKQEHESFTLPEFRVNALFSAAGEYASKTSRQKLPDFFVDAANLLIKLKEHSQADKLAPEAQAATVKAINDLEANLNAYLTVRDTWHPGTFDSTRAEAKQKLQTTVVTSLKSSTEEMAQVGGLAKYCNVVIQFINDCIKKYEIDMKPIELYKSEVVQDDTFVKFKEKYVQATEGDQDPGTNLTPGK